MSRANQTAVFAVAAALLVAAVCAFLVGASDGELLPSAVLTVLPRAVLSFLGCVVLVVAVAKLCLRCFRGGGFDLYWPWLLLALVGTLMVAPNWGASLGLSAIVLVFVARRDWNHDSRETGE